jgi:hypothetical protein
VTTIRIQYSALMEEASFSWRGRKEELVVGRFTVSGALTSRLADQSKSPPPVCSRVRSTLRPRRSKSVDAGDAAEITKLLKEVGGRQEDRTPGLRVANAALSQLS